MLIPAPASRMCLSVSVCKKPNQHLHPLPSTTHGITQDDEQDHRHGGRHRQRHQEVCVVVAALQGLGGGVVLAKLGQDPRAQVGPVVAVAGPHLGDVHLIIITTVLFY